MPDRQMVLPFAVPVSLAGEDFLVAEPNREAVDRLLSWPRWRSAALVLWGPAGCGKTHLAHVFLGRCQGLLIDHQISAFERAIANAPHVAACAVDDADRAIAQGMEKPLLHLHNTLAERGGHLLLTAEAPPARWPIGLADLRSRLLAADMVRIGGPDDELITGLLVKLLADRRLSVEEDVIRYALPRIQRSFEGIQRLVADLDAAALARKRKVTVGLLREVLAALGHGASETA